MWLSICHHDPAVNQSARYRSGTKLALSVADRAGHHVWRSKGSVRHPVRLTDEPTDALKTVLIL
jgi:hypothetical protein